jgi:hypothetical protein
MLTALFVLSAATALAFSGWYVISLRQLQSTQASLAAVNRNKMVARALIADALEYRKRNPAIDPVLQAANLLTPSLNTNAPAPRPPTR